MFTRFHLTFLTQLTPHDFGKLMLGSGLVRTLGIDNQSMKKQNAVQNLLISIN
jgi:hypothetical protein